MEASYFTDAGVLIRGRVGSLPTSPTLVANIVLRLILCPIAIVLTWVPLRLLWRNGEFPACVFVINLWLLILFVFVNAAIWHNQDFSSWWLGYGWCDLQSFVQYAFVTVYSTSVCAIMQRLSKQVGLTRVTGLSPREKHKRLIAQSLIIFPVPFLQIILTIFVQGIRFGIAPASGCTNEYDAAALFLVFYILPPLLYTMVACYYTFQTYRRFRQVDESSRAALGSTNSVAYARRQRARRKLYFMVLCILVPYTPLIAAFCAINIIMGLPWNYPSDFETNHYHGPNPYNTIYVLSDKDAGFMALNMGWIPVVSAFVAFVFFGTSKEAINVYRTYLLAVGFGRFFPDLHEPYDPDRSMIDATNSNTSYGSNATTQISTLDSITQSRKGSGVPVYPTVPTAAGEAADVRSPRSSSFFHRMFHKGSTASADNTRDVELATAARDDFPAPPAAAAPASRVLFNPGFNWFTPPVASHQSPSVAWSPITYAVAEAAQNQNLQQQRDVETTIGPVASPPHPPTSSASTAASTAPILASVQQTTGGQDRVHFYMPNTRPFDGTRTNSIGGRAVNTHVWSEGSSDEPTPLPGSTPSLGNTAEGGGAGDDGRGCKSEDNLGDLQGVRVERSITTSEVIRKI
ncbi:pheromone a factor receptor [Sporothrix schenckii 1099-18]|nr:pheromone a factor receptor [Sporothrix schenckii 1099-18]KJR86408.1 pheromone a factor receptor [Sporothrix schenckii 1099-18]